VLDQQIHNPLLRPLTLFLVALSLSIGWGIRGNFGHESGAMIAGALSAIAVALLSQRDDWHRRVTYFGFFGALGWGFGGSIAYMYPLSFTESGHTATTYYGYFATFLEGGLWCGMGAAGTALAASMPLERMRRMFMPLCFVLAFMGLRHFIEEPLERFLVVAGESTGDATWHRHESPLYWFDADWLPALMALVGVLAFELYDRKRHKGQRLIDHPAIVLPFAAIGSLAGYMFQWALRAIGLEQEVRNTLVVKLGDLSYVNPETGNKFDPEQLLTNWPQFFSDYPEHLGWGIGVCGGVAIYFYLTGRFRYDASLFLYLSLGWLIAFLALPTLGSSLFMDYGGVRVMPPRSDDWAGILGVYLAGIVWSCRYGLKPVAQVMSVGGMLGGISFATVPMIRFFLRYPGHPWRFPEGVSESLAHYQSANWHSVLEQMHGFGHGLAIAIAMSMLWRRQPISATSQQTRHWTAAFSATFVLFVVGYLNLHKLVETWVGNKSVPPVLKAPFIEVLEATPLIWFCVVWWTAATVCAILMAIHLQRRLEIVPSSWIGKGQLIYVLFVWMMVIGNLMRAIPGFTIGRMVTEWVLFMNAILATLLIVALPRPALPATVWQQYPAWRSLSGTWLRGLAVTSVLMCAYAFMTLAMYQEHLKGKPWANHRRFGPDATWRTKPILKHGDHP
jgi:hypothetical protein